MTNSESDIQEIIKYVQKLEKRVKKLESKDAIILKSVPKDIQPKPLKFSPEKLIDIYNDVPSILEEYVVEVSITAQSWRSHSEDKTIVEKSIGGNYWIILLENLDEKKYYLLPNQSKKLRISRLRSLHNMFKIQGEKDTNNDNYIIIKPALLNMIPSGKEWEIIEKGILYLGKTSPTQKLTAELEKLTENQETMPSSLQGLLNVLEKLNKNNNELKIKLNSLEKRIQKLEPEEIKWVELYHLEPEKFATLGGGNTKLKLTETTVNKLLQSSTKDIYLEADSLGQYLLKQGEKGLYLFPDPLGIFDKNSLILTRLANLFITHGEIPIASLGKDIKVIKPAKLKKINNNQWSLLESGEINF
ncbi:hypothetical protein [Cyanobacterium aponinum]|uniref:Uncharacterized protein n=1 Tax=Cyanobacterium aponinum (strain PCC 10605) TaxID=755178 RepID=K9Z3Z9_CYAAP|nr:hypothetical protein [Cyanobacterium aponinum]AFZ53295.1 hypothetical protein Cyan10605_1174 [Cyanobacterium aponinum PCC 10605]